MSEGLDVGEHRFHQRVSKQLGDNFGAGLDGRGNVIDTFALQLGDEAFLFEAPRNTYLERQEAYALYSQEGVDPAKVVSKWIEPDADPAIAAEKGWAEAFKRLLKPNAKRWPFTSCEMLAEGTVQEKKSKVYYIPKDHEIWISSGTALSAKRPPTHKAALDEVEGRDEKPRKHNSITWPGFDLIFWLDEHFPLESGEPRLICLTENDLVDEEDVAEEHRKSEEGIPSLSTEDAEADRRKGGRPPRPESRRALNGVSQAEATEEKNPGKGLDDEPNEESGSPREQTAAPVPVVPKRSLNLFTGEVNFYGDYSEGDRRFLSDASAIFGGHNPVKESVQKFLDSCFELEDVRRVMLVSGPHNPVIVDEFLIDYTAGRAQPANPAYYVPARQRFYNFVLAVKKGLEAESPARSIIGFNGKHTVLLGGELVDKTVKHYWITETETQLEKNND